MTKFEGSLSPTRKAEKTDMGARKHRVKLQKVDFCKFLKEGKITSTLNIETGKTSKEAKNSNL